MMDRNEKAAVDAERRGPGDRENERINVHRVKAERFLSLYAGAEHDGEGQE